MQRSDFHYELAARADRASAARGTACEPPARARRRHRAPSTTGMFAELPELLRAGDLLVLNDTRVLPARVIGRKPTGGRVELLLERMLGAAARARAACARATARAGRRGRAAGRRARPRRRRAPARCTSSSSIATSCRSSRRTVRCRCRPTSPRTPDAVDRERYQTVFARARGRRRGADRGAALRRALLDALAARGVERAFVTLHVGAGTFAPVRTERVEDHELHAEWLRGVRGRSCAAVERCRARGGRVVAVGTTERARARDRRARRRARAVRRRQPALHLSRVPVSRRRRAGDELPFAASRRC